MQFGAFCRYQVIKQLCISLVQETTKVGQKIDVPLLKVGRNLPSLQYWFRSPCLVQETINAVEPEFPAHGYANVKADVSTMTTQTKLFLHSQ